MLGTNKIWEGRIVISLPKMNFAKKIHNFSFLAIVRGPHIFGGNTWEKGGQYYLVSGMWGPPSHEIHTPMERSRIAKVRRLKY